MANIFKLLFKHDDDDGFDKLGLYPEKVHVTALPERRYLFTSRYLVIVSIVNICLTVMLTCFLFFLLPKKRITPRLMAINKSFQSVEIIEPDERSVDFIVLASEKSIAEYIFLRHSIVNNMNEMNRRWSTSSQIFWYSDSAVYQEFQQVAVPAQLALMQEENLTRNVEIVMIAKRYGNVWRAEFLTHDTSPKFEGVRTTVWKALLRVGFSPKQYPNKDEAIKNPLNFTITSYSVSSLGNPED